MATNLAGGLNPMMEVVAIVDELLAELDRLTAERDEALARIDREWCLGLERENVRLTAELDRLTAERDKLRYSLKLAYTAEGVAVALINHAALVAENDRLAAERDKLQHRCSGYAGPPAMDRLFAERDRLRNLAAAIEAECAAKDERVAELEAQAQFWATT